jgi:hypothetical protein
MKLISTKSWHYFISYFFSVGTLITNDILSAEETILAASAQTTADSTGRVGSMDDSVHIAPIDGSNVEERGFFCRKSKPKTEGFRNREFRMLDSMLKGYAQVNQGRRLACSHMNVKYYQVEAKFFYLF